MLTFTCKYFMLWKATNRSCFKTLQFWLKFQPAVSFSRTPTHSVLLSPKQYLHMLNLLFPPCDIVLFAKK